MPLRPVIGLAQSLVVLLLLLLAGVPAAVGGPVPGSAQLHDRPAQSLTPDDRRLPAEIDAAVAWAGIDDEPDVHALVPVPAKPGPALVFAAFPRFGCVRPAPLSHWPCASPSTGPPMR